MCRSGLSLAETYWSQHDALEDWLTACEGKLRPPAPTGGDPELMSRTLDGLRALQDEVTAHKSRLGVAVSAGRELEEYPSLGGGSFPDVGYTTLQERYSALEVWPERRN